MSISDPTKEKQPIPFRAETRQLLNILIHSLYSEREIFLRELISNASDALTRMNFLALTEREILDPSAELHIRITVDPEEHTILVGDTGLGMTAEEMEENLGTIAHSGARAFVEAAKDSPANVNEMIGQFGVGFYSAFMVAEWIRVTSRSYRPDAQAATWYSTGADTFTIEPAEKTDRGTEVLVKLKEDAWEYANEHRIRQIIRQHSDYIPYPIYVGTSEEQVNRRTALWRQPPNQVKPEEYDEFYKQFTLDPEKPIERLHLSIDAPVQLYALLFVPAQPERTIFSPRTEDGLKLYARKVLIQEYTTDLLPNALRFIQGVVDSEDIPLNVSREMVQSSRIMGQLKRILTGKVIDSLKALGENDIERYGKFWEKFQRFIKEGVAADEEFSEKFVPLLRFHTLQHPDTWVSLDQYVERMLPDQKKIYYLLGDDERALVHSPHLDQFRRRGYDVLLLADPLDSFMLLRLTQYNDHQLANVTQEELPAEEKTGQEEEPQPEPISDDAQEDLLVRFKSVLGERVADVQFSNRLVESPARLVEQSNLPPEVQRVYRLLNKEVETPKRVLEINPRHPILRRLSALPADHPLAPVVIEQVYEDALLIEGLHPDPAAMVARIQQIMQAALDNPTGES